MPPNSEDGRRNFRISEGERLDCLDGVKSVPWNPEGIGSQGESGRAVGTILGYCWENRCEGNLKNAVILMLNLIDGRKKKFRGAFGTQGKTG